MSAMVFWIAIGIMSLGVALLIAAPLLGARERMGRARRASYDLAVFRDQLAEVDRDRGSGRLDVEEAAAARGEIERRMLRAVDGQTEAEIVDMSQPPQASMGVAFPLALGLVAAAVTVAIYLNVGEPARPDAPLATRTDIASGGSAAARDGASGGADGAAMIAQLKQRLAVNSNDVAGWVTLARSHLVLGEHMEAARAFERALALEGDAAPVDLVSDYGEALVFEAFGTVSPRAVKIFERALTLDPGDVKSRFYIGMARSESGDYRGAIALWRGLTADAPPGAPWVEAVRERISEAAMKGGIMPMSVEPERPAAGAPPGAGGLGGAIAGDAQPSQADVQAVQGMAPQDQQAFIRSMVARLAEKMAVNPDDLDGWLRLGRAYKVLGDKAEADRAFGEAKSRLTDMLATMPANSPTRPAVERTLQDVEGLLAE